MSGFSQHYAIEARVTSTDGSGFSFRAGSSSTSFPPDPDGRTAPILQAQVSRRIGDVGRFAFAIPARTQGRLGLPWAWVLRSGDPVEFDVTVQRRGDPAPEKGFSHPWRNVFFGFVDSVEEELVPLGDGGFQTVTMVTCVDQIGLMQSNHFTFWRRLGESFQGSGPEDFLEKLRRLEGAGFGAGDITATSIAKAAEILLTAFIYSRIVLSRRVRLGADRLEFRQMHGYRLESDDFATSVRLEMLAPDSSSWYDSLMALTDAPAFYELFMDSVTDAEAKAGAPVEAYQPGRVDSKNVFRQEAGLKLTGGFSELLSLRPVPFPVYREGAGGFDAAAWSALPKIYAVPELGVVSRKLNRQRSHLYSVFSVDVFTSPEQGGGMGASADVYSQLVGDLHKLDSEIGYNPMDVATRRAPFFASTATPSPAGGLGAPDSLSEMSRRMAWQLLSFHQLNDLFMNGEIEVPLDLRARLGSRYVTEDMMFYVDGYTHSFPVNQGAPSTTYSVTRGLPVEMYGDRPRYRTANADWQDYVKLYLGRQRPGESMGPAWGRDILSPPEAQP